MARNAWLGIAAVVGWVAGCGSDADRAAQAARIATLEQQVKQLEEGVAGLRAQAQPAEAAAHAKPQHPFKVPCPQPWHIHAPLGAALWTCRAPEPAQGVYPQCHVVWQPQIEIETKNYFTFALNAAPQLLEIKNFKDKRTKLNNADAFEATFDAEPKLVPLKMVGALFPHKEATYAVTCFAPSTAFAAHEPAFRKIIEGFEFE